MGERINAGILALHVNGNTYRIIEVRQAGGRTVAVGRELRPDGSEGPGRILAVDKLTPIDTDPADSVDLTIPTERFSDPTDTAPEPADDGFHDWSPIRSQYVRFPETGKVYVVNPDEDATYGNGWNPLINATVVNPDGSLGATRRLSQDRVANAEWLPENPYPTDPTDPTDPATPAGWDAIDTSTDPTDPAGFSSDHLEAIRDTANAMLDRINSPNGSTWEMDLFHEWLRSHNELRRRDAEISAIEAAYASERDPDKGYFLPIPKTNTDPTNPTDPTPTGPSSLDTPTDDTPPDPSGPTDHHAHAYSPITLAAIRSLRGAILDSLSSLRPDETGKRAVLHTSLDEISALMNRAGTAPEWDGAGAVPSAPGPLGSRDRQGEPKTRRRRRRVDRKSHAAPKSLFRARTHGTARHRLDTLSSLCHPAPFATN